MAKKHSNPILSAATARIEQLRARYKESASINHSSTKGSLREAYLRQFLSEFIPSQFKVTSGFICDCGHADISPQIDLIVFDDSSLPKFALSEFVSIVPVEAARVIIEVKSTLAADTFEQMQRVADSTKAMTIAWIGQLRELASAAPSNLVPQAVFAFDSDLSIASARALMESNDQLCIVGVVDSWVLLRSPKDGSIEQIEGDNDLVVFQFISYVQIWARYIAKYFSQTMPIIDLDNSMILLGQDIGAYLTFDLPKE